MRARWRHAGRFQRGGAYLCALGLLAALAAAAASGKRENVHQPGTDCARCHTADQPTLESDPAAARAQVAPDIESRCNTCHGDEGPSHRTGMPPRTAVPETLPLSSEGLITCSTCHVVHGERNPYGDFVRVDNSRGALCLTCHQLKELQ